METTVKKLRNIFVQGAITPERIANSIAHHQVKTAIGGHDIFLGQVRADEKDGRTVSAIDYTAHEEMANKEMEAIREEAFQRFDLTCMHVYHSLGEVKAGGLCLFVFTSSLHRKDCMDATRYLVEELKKRLPVFGREVFEDGGHQWKENV
jgi:molybdopterin synthase catalytic subunit